MGTKAAFAIVLLALAYGCGGDAVSPTPVSTRLTLRTEATGGRPCRLAALVPVRIMHEADEMLFVSTVTSERLSLVWPSGFTARAVADVAELVAPDGRVIAREDAVLDGLGGGIDASGVFHICQVGSIVC